MLGLDVSVSVGPLIQWLMGTVSVTVNRIASRLLESIGKPLLLLLLLLLFLFVVVVVG